MSSALTLVSRSGGALVTVHGVVDLLTTKPFDRIRLRHLECRERTLVPFAVGSPEAFRAWPAEFYRHHRGFCHGIPSSVVIPPEESYRWFREHFKGDLRTAERNAILGRDGGLIKLCDDLVESMILRDENDYTDRVLWEYVPTDPTVRLRVAEELLREFGPLLCVGDELRPAYEIAVDLEQTIKDFAALFRGATRKLRY